MVDAGHGRRSESVGPSQSRGAIELLAVLAVVPETTATAITLLQAPSTFADLARRLRGRAEHFSLEVRAPHATLSVRLDEVEDDEAVAELVSTFLAASKRNRKP